MMKLRINPLVVADLKEIRNFIAEDNVEKAAETIEKRGSDCDQDN